MASYEILLKLEKEVTCPACLGIYTKPTRLPCQQTFCQRCVLDSKRGTGQGKVRCPRCGKTYPSHSLTRDGDLASKVNLYRKLNERNILVSDKVNDRVSVFNPEGDMVCYSVGETGGALVDLPRQVVDVNVTPGGHLVVTNQSNHQVLNII